MEDDEMKYFLRNLTKEELEQLLTYFYPNKKISAIISNRIKEEGD